jgi:hypothetical protein
MLHACADGLGIHITCILSLIDNNDIWILLFTLSLHICFCEICYVCVFVVFLIELTVVCALLQICFGMLVEKMIRCMVADMRGETMSGGVVTSGTFLQPGP